MNIYKNKSHFYFKRGWGACTPVLDPPLLPVHPKDGKSTTHHFVQHAIHTLNQYSMQVWGASQEATG